MLTGSGFFVLPRQPHKSQAFAFGAGLTPAYGAAQPSTGLPLVLRLNYCFW
jgi:hypothetical protein